MMNKKNIVIISMLIASASLILTSKILYNYSENNHAELKDSYCQFFLLAESTNDFFRKNGIYPDEKNWIGIMEKSIEKDQCTNKIKIEKDQLLDATGKSIVYRKISDQEARIVNIIGKKEAINEKSTIEKEAQLINGIIVPIP